MIDSQQLWDECSEIIRSQIAEATWKTWFSGITPVSIGDDTLVLSVHNDLIKERLQSRFDGIIKECLYEILGMDISIRFDVATEATSFGEENHLNFNKDLDQEDIYIDSHPKESSFLYKEADVENINERVLQSRQTKYTFETFVIGQSNRFAHAAALSVAEAPARAYNPLFIIGDVGLGKTHLLQAIRNYVIKNFVKMSVAYISTETFMNEFVEAIRNNTTVLFKKKYRECDVLLIDDIQFIEGKESFQEEFFHTFNSLYEASKQVVLTSDRPPGSIKTLESRLRSRFLSGLIAEIQPPELETRMAILRTKAEHERLIVPSDVLDFIASNVKDNIRELEGALIRVTAYANLNKLPLNRDLAETVLADITISRQPKMITTKEIISITAENFGVKEEDICGPSRQRELVLARQVAMYVIRDLTDFSYPSIAKEFGNRDHTTVMHAVDKISKMMSEKKNIYDLVTSLIIKIKNR